MSITGRKGAVNSGALRLVTVNVQTTREFPYLTNRLVVYITYRLMRYDSIYTAQITSQTSLTSLTSTRTLAIVYMQKL